MAAFIDVEHALDPTYARKLGVDVDNLLVSQPDYGEQALESPRADRFRFIDVLVVDSVAALVPKPNWTAKWATATWACRRV